MISSLVLCWCIYFDVSILFFKCDSCLNERKTAEYPSTMNCVKIVAFTVILDKCRFDLVWWSKPIWGRRCDYITLQVNVYNFPCQWNGRNRWTMFNKMYVTPYILQWTSWHRKAEHERYTSLHTSCISNASVGRSRGLFRLTFIWTEGYMKSFLNTEILKKYVNVVFSTVTALNHQMLWYLHSSRRTHSGLLFTWEWQRKNKQDLVMKHDQE